MYTTVQNMQLLQNISNCTKMRLTTSGKHETDPCRHGVAGVALLLAVQVTLYLGEPLVC